MSRRPDPLPDPLASTPFSTAEAAALGVSESRLRAADLDAPFVAVRSATAPSTVRELARAYAPILATGELFSHITAAVLHGIWLPLELEERMVLDVSVRKPLRAPRDRRVHGRHLIDRPALVLVVDGLPVSNPWETWAQLARYLSVTDLVVAGETRFRLLLVGNGFREPRINVRIHDAAGDFISEGDLVHEEERVLIDHEGDGHRERRQFRKDIRRVEDFTDAGWRVIRATGDDLRSPLRTLTILRRALDDRRPS